MTRTFCPARATNIRAREGKGWDEPKDFRLFPEMLAEHFRGGRTSSRRERGQVFLAESLGGEADVPADVPHNVLETAILLIIPLFQQTLNLGRLH